MTKPFNGLAGDQAFVPIEGGDALLVEDPELGLCRVDLTLKPSMQVLVPLTAPKTATE